MSMNSENTQVKGIHPIDYASFSDLKSIVVRLLPAQLCKFFRFEINCGQVVASSILNCRLDRQYISILISQLYHNHYHDHLTLS